MIRPRGSDKFLRWSQQDTVFREARKMGFNTAIVAWAIPYCRVLNSDLSNLLVVEREQSVQQAGNHLARDARQPAAQPLREHLPLAVRQSLSTARHIWVAESVVAKSLEVAATQASAWRCSTCRYDPPYFYNAAPAKTTGAAHTHRDRAADAARVHRRPRAHRQDRRPVAPLHGTGRRLEHPPPLSSPQTIPSAIVRTWTATRSHGGSRIWSKLAGPTEQLSYTAPFSALLTRKLIVAILSGELSAPARFPPGRRGPRGLPTRLTHPGDNESVSPAD